MKSKEFLSELRLIIREEVTYAVRTEVRRVLNESNTSEIVEQSVPAPKPIKKSTPKYKNQMLNDLLESTQPIGYNHNDYEEWPTMQTNNVLNRMRPQQINAAPEGVSIEAIQNTAPEVAAALTKDYRSLMKAIESKKGK